MKKIFISFFVLILAFSIGGVAKAQVSMDATSAETVAVEAVDQVKASDSTKTESTVSGQTEKDFSQKIEEKLNLPSTSDWTNVGNPGFSSGLADSTSLAINSNNIPYIAYRDDVNNSKANVMKWNGTNWVNVGTPGFSAGTAYYPSLAIGPNDIPYVVYRDAVNLNKATVMKYILVTAPSITITSPNGGETFSAGQQFTATWTSTGIPATDELYFGLIQDVTNIYYILTGSTLNDGTEVFTVPANIEPGQYRMYGRKPYTAIDDYSDSTFTIN